MPYTWIGPPVFAEGIPGTQTVYHAFRDNNADDSILGYWYGARWMDGEVLYFDVRDLPQAKERLVSASDVLHISPSERRGHARRIFSAMRDSEFGFMDWLEEHGTPEGEL